MSTDWAADMRGPRVQARLVLVLLLLLSGPTHTGLCQEEDAEAEEEVQPTEAVEDQAAPEYGATDPPEGDLDTALAPTGVPDTDEGGNGEDNGSGTPSPDDTMRDASFETGPTTSPDDEGLDMLTIAPVAAVIPLILIIIVGVVIYRRCNSQNSHSDARKEDPYLEGSSTEKVPMPMFEEDVPSVLELEMDQLDDWMKKDDEPTDLSQQA